jgi:hypothetical protein
MRVLGLFIEKYKEKGFYFLTTPPASLSAHPSKSACLPPHICLLARTRACRALTDRRARRPRVRTPSSSLPAWTSWPPRHSYTRSAASAVTAPSHLPPHRASGSRACAGKPPPPSTHVPRRLGYPDHHRSLSATVSRPEHRLHLARPALASACRGKAPLCGNHSPEHDRAHWRALLHGLLSSAPPFSFSLHASRSPRFPDACAPLPVPSLS